MAESAALFIKKGCEKCIRAKSLLEIAGMIMMEIDIESSDAKKQLIKYGIGKVPTLIILDDKGDIVDSARGLDEIDAFISSLSQHL